MAYLTKLDVKATTAKMEMINQLTGLVQKKDLSWDKKRYEEKSWFKPEDYSLISEGTKAFSLTIQVSDTHTQTPVLELLGNTCKKLDSFVMNFTEDTYGFTMVNAFGKTVKNASQSKKSMEIITNTFSRLISKNRTTLEQFTFNVSTEAEIKFDCKMLSTCICLKELDLSLSGEGELLNVEALLPIKDTLRVLRITEMTKPLKNEQLIWIGQHFKNLKVLQLLGIHYCLKDRKSEVNPDVILSILNGLPELRSFNMKLGFCGMGVDAKDEDDDKYDDKHKNDKGANKDDGTCGKVQRLRNQVMGKVQNSVWNAVMGGKGRKNIFGFWESSILFYRGSRDPRDTPNPTHECEEVKCQIF